jgi:multidrug efflux system outer membrane protein
MNGRLILALSSALALSGCINLAPKHERPALSTAPAYDAQYRPDGSVTASQIGWQDYFTDQRLDALIDSALANNRDLAAATARIEQARAQYRIQDSRRLPALVANASGTRTHQPLSSLIPGDTAAGSVTFNQFNVGVGISAFELDFWGRLANLSEAARSEYLATVATQRAFYLSLIGDVASTYYQLIESEQQIALAEATAQSRRDGLHIAQLRMNAGVTSALPYRQAETLLTQAEQQLAEQQLTAARTRNQLAVLVGGKIPESLPPGRTQADQAPLDRVNAGLPSDLLLQRPDIIAAEERLKAARANIGAARAAFFPSISLTGNAGLTSNALGHLFEGAAKTWSFGPSISLPIFDWGAREADLGLARAKEVEAVATYDSTVQNAFREVSDGLAGRRWLADQATALERGVAAQEKIAHIARLRYREGVADYLEVLDAERNLFSAQQQLLATHRAQYQNLITLFIALGGGQGGQAAASPATTPPPVQ